MRTKGIDYVVIFITVSLLITLSILVLSSIFVSGNINMSDREESINISNKSFDSDLCTAGDRQYSVNINLTSFSDDGIDGRIKLNFKDDSKDLQFRAFGGEYTDIDLTYYVDKTRGIVYPQGPKLTRNGSKVSFNVSFMTDDGYWFTGEHKDYTMIRPTLRMHIITNNGTYSKTKNDMFGCISNINSSSSDINISSSVVGEETILAIHDERRPRIETYDIDFGKNSKLTVVGHTKSHKTKIDIEYISEVISYIEPKFKSKNRTVIMYILDSIEGEAPGYAYSGVSENMTHLYVQNDYQNREDALGIVGHEWVHSIQNHQTQETAHWSFEGFAEYLGGLTEINAGGNRKRIVNEIFEFGWNQDSDNVTLSKPSSWKNAAEYNRGGRISYLTDLSIRNHTDNEKSIFDLIRSLNSLKSKVSHNNLSREVSDLSDNNYRSRFNSYVTSNNTVSIRSELEKFTPFDQIYIPEITNNGTIYDVSRCMYNETVHTISKCEFSND